MQSHPVPNAAGEQAMCVSAQRGRTWARDGRLVGVHEALQPPYRDVRVDEVHHLHRQHDDREAQQVKVR
jgi:hypothetical protein